MIGVSYSLFGFLLIRLSIALSNLLAKPWNTGEAEDSVSSPLVSVLIPARNEERKIGHLLEDLTKQDHTDLEIWVYDDESSDGTRDVVEGFTKKDPRIRCLQAVALPNGWMGKNHACHQLALQAQGDFLLFLDADVRVSGTLIDNALKLIKRYDLTLLSIFPVQLMHTAGERATVPLMNWILVSLLPLTLTRTHPSPAFSAANGQFMLFNAAVYREHLFHKQVRTNPVEDMAIFRIIKKLGLPVYTLLSNGQIRCRMYEGYERAIQGFAKNIFTVLGNPVLAWVFALITTFGVFVVAWQLGWVYALSYIFLAVLLRSTVSMASGQSILQNVLYAPLQQLGLLHILGVASYNKLRKRQEWKGRKIR